MDHLKAVSLCVESYNFSDNIWSAFETDALVLEDTTGTWICFRGTESTPKPTKKGWSNFFDVLKDIRIFPYKTILGWWAHKGFAKGAEAWVNKFINRINKYKPVYITGHSLGAAIAIQSIPLLKAKGVSVSEVVVFAEPASWYKGDDYLYRSLGIPTTSYLNSNDFIRAVVPWAKTGVYRTYLNPKGWLSLKAHSAKAYQHALTESVLQ